MNIAICDRIPPDRDILSCYIRKYCSERSWDCRIDAYGSCEELLRAFSANSYQMVFIDLYHSGLENMEGAKKIRSIDTGAILVLITDMETNFQEGYELGIRNYLVKPLEEGSVRSCLRRSSKYIFNCSLEVLSEKTHVKVPQQDIRYIENLNGTSIIHTENYLIKTGSSLDELEKQLEGSKFIRCHPCYLVNIDSISKINVKSLEIKNGREIPILLPDREKVLERYFSTRLVVCTT